MLKKTLIISIISLNLNSTAVAGPNISKDLVDLPSWHWASPAVKQVLDEYQLLSAFPDHTFRGYRRINRFELAAVTLKLIKWFEEEYRIDLGNTHNNLPLFPVSFYQNIETNHWAWPSLNELRNNYQLIISPPDEEDIFFDGEHFINRYEIAYMLDTVIQMLERKLSSNGFNPYQPMVDPIVSVEINKENWHEVTKDRMTDRYHLMVGKSEDDFAGESYLSRFELAILLQKTIMYSRKLI